MTGLAVRHAVTVHGVVTVIHHLVHLTHEVLPLVDPHSVGSPMLQWNIGNFSFSLKNLFI